MCIVVKLSEIDNNNHFKTFHGVILRRHHWLISLGFKNCSVFKMDDKRENKYAIFFAEN